MSRVTKPRSQRTNYNADRFHVVMYVRSNGEHSTTYNTGTSSFQHIWSVSHVGDQIVLKTTTGRYLVTAHDDAIKKDPAVDDGLVKIGPYLTFNDKHSAIMCAAMRATKGRKVED